MNSAGGPFGSRPDDRSSDGPQDVRPSDRPQPIIRPWAEDGANPTPTHVVDQEEERPWTPAARPDPVKGASAVAAPVKRRASRNVKIGLTAAAVLGLGAAVLVAGDDDDEEPTHAAVCVDQKTGNRVDDDRCDDGSGHAHPFMGWYFFAYGMSSPRIGAPVSGGSFTPPQGSSYVKGGVPRTGGVVSSSTVKGGSITTSRGGFGGSAKGSGG